MHVLVPFFRDAYYRILNTHSTLGAKQKGVVSVLDFKETLREGTVLVQVQVRII